MKRLAAIVSISLLASACAPANQVRAVSGTAAPSVVIDADSQMVTIARSGSQPSRQGPAENFTGQVDATGKEFRFAYVDLASAYAWRGQQAEAAASVAELLKLRPGYTVQRLVQEGSGFSDNPAFRKEYLRIVEGARKAGLPES